MSDIIKDFGLSAFSLMHMIQALPGIVVVILFVRAVLVMKNKGNRDMTLQERRKLILRPMFIGVMVSCLSSMLVVVGLLSSSRRMVQMLHTGYYFAGRLMECELNALMPIFVSLSMIFFSVMLYFVIDFFSVGSVKMLVYNYQKMKRTADREKDGTSPV